MDWDMDIDNITDKTKQSLIGRLGVGIFLNCGLAIWTYMNRCIRHSIPHDIHLHTLLHTLMLEPKISKSVLRCSSEHTNLRFRKLLKLQLGVTGISDIEWVKPKVLLLD